MKSHSAESTAVTRPSELDRSFPAGWRVDNFERLAVLQRGFDLPSSARTTGKVPIIGSNGIVGWHSEARVRGPGVVTGRSGSIGESTYVEGEYWPLNTSLYVSNFHDNIPRFVHYFIQWFDLSRFASGVSVPTLNRNSVYGTEVKIPSPREQEKIATVLWKLQRAIATQDRLIATTRDLKQSAMNQLFTRGMRNEPLKDTEIGQIPFSWTLARCEDVTRSITVGVVVRPASHYVPTGVPAFRSFNVREDLLDDRNLVYFDQATNDSVLAKSKLATGDVLIIRTGYPGTSCVVPEKFNGANCIDLVVVRPDSTQVQSAFLSRFFNSHLGRKQTLSSSHGLAQQHLNVGAVKSTLIVAPTIEEQSQIVAALTTIDRKLAHHQKKRAALNDLFQTLLHKLMTGEIRVSDIDIDTSEVSMPTEDQFVGTDKLIATAR